MGNKKMHPRFFDVMHLGMSDPDSEVREYAAVYINMQGLPDFTNDQAGYANWRKQNKDRTANEIVEAKSSHANKQVDKDIENADALAAKGWKFWQARNFVSAEENFSKAVKLDPESTNAWNGLGCESI